MTAKNDYAKKVVLFNHKDISKIIAPSVGEKDSGISQFPCNTRKISIDVQNCHFLDKRNNKKNITKSCIITRRDLAYFPIHMTLECTLFTN